MVAIHHDTQRCIHASSWGRFISPCPGLHNTSVSPLLFVARASTKSRSESRFRLISSDGLIGVVAWSRRTSISARRQILLARCSAAATRLAVAGFDKQELQCTGHNRKWSPLLEWSGTWILLFTKADVFFPQPTAICYILISLYLISAVTFWNQMQILSYIWFDKMADASEKIFQRRKALAEQAVSGGCSKMSSYSKPIGNIFCSSCCTSATHFPSPWLLLPLEMNKI